MLVNAHQQASLTGGSAAAFRCISQQPQGQYKVCTKSEQLDIIRPLPFGLALQQQIPSQHLERTFSSVEPQQEEMDPKGSMHPCVVLTF